VYENISVEYVKTLVNYASEWVTVTCHTLDRFVASKRSFWMTAHWRSQNHEDFSPEPTHAINPEKLHFHAPIHDVGKWGMTKQNTTT